MIEVGVRINEIYRHESFFRPIGLSYYTKVLFLAVVKRNTKLRTLLFGIKKEALCIRDRIVAKKRLIFAIQVKIILMHARLQ